MPEWFFTSELIGFLTDWVGVMVASFYVLGIVSGAVTFAFGGPKHE